MKEFILICSLLSLLLTTNAQNSVDKGRLQFKLGNSLYFGKASSSNSFEENLNSGSKSFSTIQTQFSVHYNTHKNIALGIFLSGGPGDKDSTSYNTGSFGFLAEYYLINKPKFNLFLDVSIGGLNYNASSKPDSSYYAFSGKGAVNSVGFGLNKYFGNVFGLTLRSGYMRNSVRLESYSIDDVNSDYINSNQVKDVKTLFDGGYVNFGIVIKIRNKSPKSE